MSEMSSSITSRLLEEDSNIIIGEGELNNPTNIPGFKQTTNFRPRYAKDVEKKKSKKLISKFFSNMSRFGMSYDEKVIDNMKAIPLDKNLLPKETQLINQDLFTTLATNGKVKTNQDKSFFDIIFSSTKLTLLSKISNFLRSLLTKLSLGGYSKAIKNAKTDLDWLSEDEDNARPS